MSSVRKTKNSKNTLPPSPHITNCYHNNASGDPAENKISEEGLAIVGILKNELNNIIEDKLDGLITKKIDEAVEKIFVKLEEKDAKIEEPG